IAKYDKYIGIHIVDPVDRHAAIPEVIIWIALEALPVKANTQPWSISPRAFQNKVPFSSASATPSSTSVFAVAQLPLRIWLSLAMASANIRGAARPISRAYSSPRFVSAVAASG